MNLETGELLIVRLWRWAPDRIKDDAEKEVRASRQASISVFGISKLPDEDLETAMRRLTTHVASIRNAKYAAFTTETKLAEAGFGIRENEPPRHHFDVLLENHNDEDEVRKLADIFDQFDRRKFPSCLPAVSI